MGLEQLAHIFPYTARVNHLDHLEIGGCDSVDLAHQFGTPLYVFDEESLRLRCREFLQGFRSYYPDTEVIYACKAFINPALARLFYQEGLGLDVVSGGELSVAQAVSFPPEKIYFHGNNKTSQELEQALDYRIGRIVVDNFYELHLLNALAGKAGLLQSILLRVTPGVDPHTHTYTTTGTVDSKFGFPVTTGDAEKAAKEALSLPHLRLKGLHFHLGSPIFELEPYSKGIEVVLELAAHLKGLKFEVRELSPGGGFAIPYTREQRAPSPENYAQAIVATLKERCKALQLSLPRLVIEPGRAIVGPACVALYTVGSIKEIPGIRKYIAVDGGMGDNIRPALYGARYEVVAANRMGEELMETVTIAGKFCESGDILVKDALLPRLGPGDLVAIPASGAYSPSMASNYNLAPRPAIVMVKNGQARLIRRRETPQDLMNCDLP